MNEADLKARGGGRKITKRSLINYGLLLAVDKKEGVLRNPLCSVHKAEGRPLTHP